MTTQTTVEEDELRDAAAALLGEDATCTECDPPRTFTGPNAARNLKLHQSNKHGAGAAAARSRQRPPAGSPPRGRGEKVPASEAAIKAVVDEAVGYVTVGAGFLSYALPHTGIAIAGVPDGEGGWIVQSRAVVAGGILAQHARTNPRILAVLERFNEFCRGSEAATLAASLGTALAVDLQVIRPDQEVSFGPIQLGPKLIIGDVIEEVDRMREEWLANHPAEAAAMAQAQAEAEAANGHHKGRTAGAKAATEVTGGVENT